MPDQNNEIKSDYAVLSELKRQKIERAKKDTGYFKELVLTNQFEHDIKCREQVHCFEERITKLELTKNFIKSAIKLCGIASAIVAFVALVISIIQAII